MKRLLFLLATVLAIPACYVTTTNYPPVVVNEDRHSAPPPAHRPAPSPSYFYHYYPDAQVYFDSRRRVYFYNNRGQWRKTKRLPSHIQLDDYVNLTLRTDLPYTQFHVHRNQYPGKPEFVYHYFPKARVYYHPDRDLYYYFKRGRWQRGRHLPRYIHINPDRFVVINSHRRRPYLDNREHMDRFPTKHHRREHYAYHYYPDSEVYFDPRRRLYFFYDRGQWQEVRRLPRRFRLNRSRRVDINHDHARRPYDAHADHRQRYRSGHGHRNSNMHRASHQYWYYPDSHVYFDEKRRLYFYQRGDAWTQTQRLPRHIRTSKHRVRLDMTSTRPYEQFHEHTRQYPSKTRMRSIGRKPGSVTPAPQNRRLEPREHHNEERTRRHHNVDRAMNEQPQSGHMDSRRDMQENIRQPRREQEQHRQHRNEQEPLRTDRRDSKRDMHENAGRQPSRNHGRADRQNNALNNSAAARIFNYRYYPDAKVYYDPNRRVYFEKKGQRWTQSKQQPRSLRRHKRSVDVSSASNTPYTDFNQHVNNHPPSVKDSGRSSNKRRGRAKHEDDDKSGRGKH